MVAVGGHSLGPECRSQSCFNEIGTRSVGSIPHGGSPWPFHLESLSARSLLWPAMWDVSTSMPVEETRILNFSEKRAKGIVVVKRLLEMLSAAELSDNVGILMGIRKPG